MALMRCGNTLMTGPDLTLCTSEKAYLKLMKQLRVVNYAKWVREDMDACTHMLRSDAGFAHVVVCIRARENSSAIAIAALLVHEAVHVWQFHRDNIQEREPGAEQEAYAIQNIAYELMAAYSRSQQS